MRQLVVLGIVLSSMFLLVGCGGKKDKPTDGPVDGVEDTVNPENDQSGTDDAMPEDTDDSEAGDEDTAADKPQDPASEGGEPTEADEEFDPESFEDPEIEELLQLLEDLVAEQVGE